MKKVNELSDLYETAEAEDDRWTMNKCQLELDEINRELTEIEQELWYNNDMKETLSIFVGINIAIWLVVIIQMINGNW